MSRGSLPDYESDEIDLTNRDLVSLFLQYPDLADDDNESTAASDFGEDVDASILSNTTTHTTPLRNDPVPFLGSRPPPEFPAFIHRLNESNLPKKAVDYLNSLGHMVLQIGRLLFPPTGNLSVKKQDLQEARILCLHMVSLLESSCERVNDQIDNVGYILTLAPFTVQPAPEDLWANYKQMAALIIEHTHLPSHHERDLLNCLAHVYDAYVYHPALNLFQTIDHDQSIQASLDDLYHVLMTVEERYKQWWTDVKELGDLYTKPTMRRILNSPVAMQQVIEQEETKEAAELAANNPDGLGLQPVSEKVLEMLRTNMSRQRVEGAAYRSRFRREQTVSRRWAALREVATSEL